MKCNIVVTASTTLMILITVQASQLAGLHLEGITAQEDPREAKLAAARIKLPKGLQADLFAAEPLLANPVSFCFDLQGNIYVAETYRLHDGVTDNRGHMDWLDDDLACLTVADREAKYHKYLKDRFSTYERERDQVRMLIDSQGKGRPDKSFVFSDTYRRAVDGIGAGVLAYRGKVLYTCIPDVWELQDTKGTHQADVKKSLSTGYGVHTSFLGHDLHGLTVSPVDGKIYYSLGDRGAHVVTQEGNTIDVPHCGAVFRCNPDGSELELFAKGLRNPQELAFDDDGNLFTGDNNSDSGDKARFVYLPEGADCGWHIGWQYMERPSSRGCWNSERMWYPPRADQPAFILPPLINIADGPSGLAYYPGTGLPERYQGHFFLADFRGASNISGIRSFAVKPKGAGFEVVDSHEFAWGVLATDVDFGPDGGLYILDWVEGWDKTGKGRIFRVSDPAYLQSEAARNIKQLLASDWSKKSIPELALLLSHVDRRVRMEAQGALVHSSSRQEAMEACLAQIEQATTENGKLFAIWALGQLLKKEKSDKSLAAVHALLQDHNPRIVAAVLRLLSEKKPLIQLKAEEFVLLLSHPDDHVKAQAALCLAKQRAEGTFPAILKLLEMHGKDPWLRHAATMALVSLIEQQPALWEQVTDTKSSVNVKLASVVAARRLLAEKQLLTFLADQDLVVRQEAIRAIHDEPGLAEAKRELARLPITSDLSIPVQLRLLNALLISGDSAAADRLGAYAAKSVNPEPLRVEAIKMLASWAHPSGRDWVIGLWRPIAPRSADPAKQVFQQQFTDLRQGSPKVLAEAMRAIEKLKIHPLGADCLAIAKESARPIDTRLAAMKAAVALNAEGTEALVANWLSAPDAKQRQAAQEAMVALNPELAVSTLEGVLAQGELREKQTAILLLAKFKTAAADKVLERWLQEYAAGKVNAALQVELREAAEQRSRPAWKSLLQAGLEQVKKEGPYPEYRAALQGGDAEAGRKVFFEKTAVGCTRCHKIGQQGGAVGPELTKIGKDKTREYLLEAIVDPNKTIAKGFELCTFLTSDGVVHQGVVLKADAATVTIITPEAKTIVLKKADIEDRKTGKSAMPEEAIKLLSLRELRDLVEYLSGLK